jgi:hypothetical protein
MRYIGKERDEESLLLHNGFSVSANGFAQIPASIPSGRSMINIPLQPGEGRVRYWTP